MFGQFLLEALLKNINLVVVFGIVVLFLFFLGRGFWK